MSSAVPFLTFQPAKGQLATEIMAFYTGLLPDDEVLFVEHHDPDEEGRRLVQVAEFTVAGQRFRCSDSYIEHQWDLNPAWSVWLTCDDEEQQQRLIEALGRDGVEHMPLDDYGFGPFAWVQDRFGVSWQLALEPAGS